MKITIFCLIAVYYSIIQFNFHKHYFINQNTLLYSIQHLIILYLNDIIKLPQLHKNIKHPSCVIYLTNISYYTY